MSKALSEGASPAPATPPARIAFSTARRWHVVDRAGRRPVGRVCRVPGCKSQQLRHRQLCRPHYEDAEIRRRYPNLFRSRPDTKRGHQLPPPTHVRPGPAKVPVLEERARRRLSLWNPLDPALDRHGKRLMAEQVEDDVADNRPGLLSLFAGEAVNRG